MDTPAYHQTHSGFAVASMHEALWLCLADGRAERAADYARHENALREAITAMGCTVTSNMTSLLVMDLPETLAGREKDLVQAYRADGFGIWTTLSEPVQIRIGILNQLSVPAICEIAGRFADAMIAFGATGIDKSAILARIAGRLSASDIRPALAA